MKTSRFLLCGSANVMLDLSHSSQANCTSRTIEFGGDKQSAATVTVTADPGSGGVALVSLALHTHTHSHQLIAFSFDLISNGAIGNAVRTDKMTR